MIAVANVRVEEYSRNRRRGGEEKNERKSVCPRGQSRRHRARSGRARGVANLVLLSREKSTCSRKSEIHRLNPEFAAQVICVNKFPVAV